jgi:hypothetical protein
MRDFDEFMKKTEEDQKYFFSGRFMKRQPDTKIRDEVQRDFLIYIDAALIRKSVKIENGELIYLERGI